MKINIDLPEQRAKGILSKTHHVYKCLMCHSENNYFCWFADICSFSHRIMNSPILLLLVLAYYSNGQDLPRDMRDVQVEEVGREVSLRCWGDSGGPFIHWVLPNTNMISGSYENSSEPSIYLLADGELYFSRVEFEHLGVYLCYHGSHGSEMYSRVDLHLPGLWDIYRKNVIIGCSAAAVMLLVFTTGCVVHNLRYERKQDESHINGYENRTYPPNEYGISKQVPNRYDDVEIGNYDHEHGLDGATKMWMFTRIL